MCFRVVHQYRIIVGARAGLQLGVPKPILHSLSQQHWEAPLSQQDQKNIWHQELYWWFLSERSEKFKQFETFCETVVVGPHGANSSFAKVRTCGDVLFAAFTVSYYFICSISIVSLHVQRLD